jgi:hypothetical protein
MPVSRKSKKNISKKRKTNKNIRKMKGGGEKIFYINEFGTDYFMLTYGTVKKTIHGMLLSNFQHYDPSNVNAISPAKKIRLFDNFNRLLGEVKPDDLTKLSDIISRESTINLINPDLSGLYLNDNNLKLIKFEITTYDDNNSRTSQV